MKDPRFRKIRNEMLEWLQDVTPRFIVVLWVALLSFIWIPGGLVVWLFKDYGFIGSYKYAINASLGGWIFLFDPLYYDQHIGDHPMFDRFRERRR